MRHILFLCSVSLLSFNAFAQDWTPPANPDPSAILNEARADARQGKHETALAKHVRYHENALAISPAQRGVRLSFALSDWQRLGEQYPAAMAKLKSIRDTAQKKVLEEKGDWEAFSDMSAINRTIDELAKTKDVFQQLDEKNPKLAAQVFDQAKPALLEAKAYKLFMKYVDPMADYKKIEFLYDRLKQLDQGGRFAEEQAKFQDKKFSNDVATLVAVLTIEGNKADAETIAVSAKQKLDDPDFHEALIKALSGTVPDPWP